MSGKMLVCLGLLISLTACSNPKYVTIGSPSTDSAQEKGLASCMAKFGSGECVSIAWEKRPTESDFGSFILKTSRKNLADGSAVPEDLPGQIGVVIWMPAMGHGSSPVTLERLDVGTYRVSRVFFTMKGDWEIRVQLRDGNSVKDQAIVPVTF